MRTLRYFFLSICVLGFFLFSWFSRYQPVSLDLQAPVSFTCEIKGMVKRPGVYEIASGSSLQMLIDEAGGSLANADLSTLSLKEPVMANAVIVIPEKAAAPLISINTASLEQLCTLPGIGPAIAGRIIEYRKEKSFRSLEQLMEIKGIGQKMFAGIQERICL